jgi:transcription initiation factor TFIIB
MGERNFKSSCCSALLIQRDSELGCNECGKIFENEDVFVETTGSSKIPGMLIDDSTIIPNGNSDAFGKRFLDPKTVKKLQFWDRRSKKRNQSRLKANHEISRLCEKMGIPDFVKKRSEEIFIDCQRKKLLRGRDANIFSVACLYAACRELNIPKNIAIISEHTEFGEREIFSDYKTIFKNLELSVSIQSPIVFLSKIANRTNPPMDTSVQILARKIIENYSESAGKDPHGVAGAALYLAASIKGKKVTQSQISRASGVTEATIRKNLKFLEKDFSNLKKIGE